MIRRKNNPTNNLILVLSMLTLSLGLPLSLVNYNSHALSPSQRTIFNYSIPYYNDCVTGGGGSIGNNTDYEGNQILTDDQMAQIEKLQPVYQASGEKYGVPWQMIAVVHLREHGLATSGPSNGQGPYQDYERDNVPSELRSGSGWKIGEYTDEEFQIATDWCAADLSRRAGDRDLNDDNVVKDVFFAYNGKASVYIDQAKNLGFSDEEANWGEGSPYVMNKADAQRDPNKNPTGWGQIKEDNGPIVYPANQDYGAYVVYAGLGGGSGTASATSAKDTGPYIWVGDSRTEGMKSAISGNDDNSWVAQSSEGYDWFTDTAITEVTKQLTEDDTIVFNFGVNDLYNIDKYVEKLNELVDGDWSIAKKIIVMSVNPVIDGKNDASNAEIEEFNKKMKDGLSPGIKFIDTYSKLKDSLVEEDYDDEGLHYTNEIYQQIYDMIRGAVTNNRVECEGDTSLSGDFNNRVVQIATEWAEWGDTYGTCYSWGGGHSSKEDTDKRIENHFTGEYGVDCSGFASAVIYKASGVWNSWDTQAMCDDTENFEEVNDPQPGDFKVTCTGHVAVILEVHDDGSFTTAESTGNWENGRGEASNACGGTGPNFGNFNSGRTLRYVGEGSD